MKHETPIRVPRAIMLIAGCLLAGVQPVAAQIPGATVVAIADAFPDIDARALVVRDGQRDYVVLRPEEATVEALAVSLRVLDSAKQRSMAAGEGEMIPISGFALNRDLDAAEQSRLRTVLDRLHARPTTDIGTLGRGRWINYEGR